MKGVSRERIVQAAFDVLNEAGISGVTVRAVASRLDVKAPALYYHVRNKQELLDEMGTEVQRRVAVRFEAYGAELAWPQALEVLGHTLRDEYLQHRDGARTFAGTRLTDPEILRTQELWLRRAVDAGVALGRLLDAAEATTAFVVGFVIEEQERRQSAEANPERYSTESRDAALGEGVPLVVASGHFQDDSDQRFARQLHFLLTGIEVAITNQTGT